MVKVCHITTVHQNRYDVRIFEKECSSLAKKAYEVTLIVNDDKTDESKNGVSIISLNTKPRNRIDRFTRIAKRAYKKALEINAEIYHLHDPELLGIGLKLIRREKKVIFDCHDFTALQIMTKEYLPLFIRKPLALAYRKYEISVLRKFSGIVVPCLYDGKDYFEKVNVPKVIIGNLPINLEPFCEERTEKKDEKKVCYIGSIDEARGIFPMVKAAALAEVRLVLMGDMSEELLEKLKKMPEYKNVDYLGRLPHDDAIREASKCSVGLCLLQNQGEYAKCCNLPTKLYEYMAIGLPTVVSSFPFYLEQLKKYRFGIPVNQTDEKRIAEQIKKILTDSELERELICEGKKAILEEYSWSKDEKKLFDFYCRLFS